jgi:uncharacterized protein
MTQGGPFLTASPWSHHAGKRQLGDHYRRDQLDLHRDQGNATPRGVGESRACLVSGRRRRRRALASEALSPAEVARAVGAYVARLVAGDLSPAEWNRQLDQLLALYSERTDVRHPFAPLGGPVLRTRDELRAHFAGSPPEDGGPESFMQANVVVHETTDPEVVVIEFSYEISRTGHHYSVPMIFVMRVRGGEIVESRDYAHHVEMARAAGGLDDLARALADTT